MQPEITPVGIAQAGPDQLRIDWKDGARSLYAVRALRLACRCAVCVEEMTGRPLLRGEDVPEDVRPVRISPVGRYGVQIAWTDGHDTGIYTFEYLRSLDPEGSDPGSVET
jgi:ATP-binding protein involved in chromosome partitioning